jgi:hypothetical protein
MNPKEMPLTLFVNNVAHSNGDYALKTNGYSSKEQAVFRGFLSFLNEGMSFDFIESEHMRIEGGVFSDEVQGLELGAADIRNSTILQWTIPACIPNPALVHIQRKSGSSSSVFRLEPLDHSSRTTRLI